MTNNSSVLLNLSSAKNNPVSLKVVELYKSFSENEVLKGVNFQVESSHTHVILGKSGSGKSVFLKCIVGLERYDSGNVYLNGLPVTEPQDLLPYRIGFVFQSSALFNSMTVGDNVGIYLKEHRLVDNDKTYAALVSGALELVGLSGKENLYPSQISGGMQKRVAIARAVVMNPDMIFLDEPTTGLDPMMTQTIGDLILTLKNRINTTQIVVTHDVDLGIYIADRISIMNGGKMIDVGTPENLKNTDDEEVKNFISAKFK